MHGEVYRHRRGAWRGDARTVRASADAIRRSGACGGGAPSPGGHRRCYCGARGGKGGISSWSGHCKILDKVMSYYTKVATKVY